MDQDEPVFVLPNDEGFLQMILLNAVGANQVPNEFPAGIVPHEPVMVAEVHDNPETEEEYMPMGDNDEQLLVDSLIGVALVPNEFPAAIVPHEPVMVAESMMSKVIVPDTRIPPMKLRRTDTDLDQSLSSLQWYRSRSLPKIGAVIADLEKGEK
ncbi:hypothetical protein BC833DRAFT_607523 [Globomyces pollinis-pini]|nr:hypothetical protein BC833DRAFT_607523 [Globomyces pollinis-pini]